MALSKRYSREDYEFLDNLNKAREARKVENEAKKYALVCFHLAMTTQPMKAVCIQVKGGTATTHEKHDGTTWCCDNCAIAFDKMSIQDAQRIFLMKEQKDFQKNIRSFILA